MNYNQFVLGKFYIFADNRFDLMTKALSKIIYYAVAEPHKVNENKAFSIYLIEYPSMEVSEKALIRLQQYRNYKAESDLPDGCDQFWIEQATILWENYQSYLPEYTIEKSRNQKVFRVYDTKKLLLNDFGDRSDVLIDEKKSRKSKKELTTKK